MKKRWMGLTVTLALAALPPAALAGALGLITNGDMQGGFLNTGWWCSSQCGYTNSGQNFYIPNNFGWNNAGGCGPSCSGTPGANYATHQDTAFAHSGSSTKFTFCQNPGSGFWNGCVHQVIGVPNGTAFRVKLWCRWDGGNLPPVLVWKPGASADPNSGYNMVRGDDDDAWTRMGRWCSVSMYGTNTDAGNQVTVYGGGAAHPGTNCNHVWIDDIEASLIPTSLQNGSFEGSNADDRAALVRWDISDCGSKRDFAACVSGSQTYGPPAAQSGTYYAFANSVNINDSKKMCLSQVVQVNPGTAYQFSCHAFAPTGQNGDLPIIGIKNGTHYSSFRLAEPTFDASTTLSTRGAWTQLNVNFTPTASTVTLILFCKHTGTTNWGAAFDNASLSTVTSATVQGTVTDSATGSPIAGSVVSFSNGGSVTTDVNGFYTKTVTPTTQQFWIQAKKDAHFNSSASIIAGISAGQVVTRNLTQTTPGAGLTVYDTFTRADNTVIGQTEDSNNYNWIESWQTNASITGNKLLLDPPQIGDGFVLQGEGMGFEPVDVDISCQLTITGNAGDYLGPAYRQAEPTSEVGNWAWGYAVKCRQDGTHIQLGYYDTGVPQWYIDYSPNPPIDWSIPHTLRVKGLGSSHTVWLDGAQIITGTSTNKLTGGLVMISKHSAGGTIDDFAMANVSDGSPVDVPTIAEAKTVAGGTNIRLTGKVVSAGTDQLKLPLFFYIQESGAGMRVRTATTVRQGDRVTVVGIVQRANDGGAATTYEGEREVNASSVTVTYGPNTLPAAAVVTNRNVGGTFTALDTDGYSCQPGVWAASTGANCGYDQITEASANNIGTYVQTSGTVVQVDDANRFFYINDGSNVVDGGWVGGAPSPPGIRVLAPPSVPLNGLLNKSVTIHGIVGSVAASEAGSPSGSCGAYIRNIRVIRPAPEMFLDYNQNGFWDPGEPYIDIDANGVYNGIAVTGVAGPTFTSRFDRYGTLIKSGAAFMPKGLYMYTVSSGDLTTARNQGFNSVQCFDAMTPADLATFNSVGVKAFPSLANPANRSSWMAVRTDAAIQGWYLYDEPEWHGITASQALTDFNWVKSQDPYHVIGESHADINSFDDYAASDEMCWVDRYPVGNSTIQTIADFMVAARAGHGNNPYYPVWQYVQMFDEAPNFVQPTAAQMRCMVWMAAAYWVKGWFYFSYELGNSDWWACWAEALNINNQMTTLRPFFVLPWVPLDVTTSNWTVRAGGFRVGNNALLITVNGESTNQTTTITLPGVPDNATLSAPIGGPGQALTGRSFSYTYGPHEVRALLYGSIPPDP